MPGPQLSLVIPLFNEADNLEPLAREIAAALDGADLDYETLFIDDGSTDSSPEHLARLAAAEPRIRIVRLARNSGQSAAFAAGFRLARGEVVVTLDADLQNDPADIPRLVGELAGCDVVCGVRAERHDSWVRRISSRVANGVRNRLTGESIRDVGCSLRAYRSQFVRQVPLFDGMHRFLPTLLKLDGARLREIEVGHRPRHSGRSKYGISNRLWKALVDLFAVRWMQRRWIDRRLAREIPAAVPEPGADTAARAGREGA